MKTLERYQPKVEVQEILQASAEDSPKTSYILTPPNPMTFTQELAFKSLLYKFWRALKFDAHESLKS